MGLSLGLRRGVSLGFMMGLSDFVVSAFCPDVSDPHYHLDWKLDEGLDDVGDALCAAADAAAAGQLEGKQQDPQEDAHQADEDEQGHEEARDEAPDTRESHLDISEFRVGLVA